MIPRGTRKSPMPGRTRTPSGRLSGAAAISPAKRTDLTHQKRTTTASPRLTGIAYWPFTGSIRCHGQTGMLPFASTLDQRPVIGLPRKAFLLRTAVSAEPDGVAVTHRRVRGELDHVVVGVRAQRCVLVDQKHGVGSAAVDPPALDRRRRAPGAQPRRGPPSLQRLDPGVLLPCRGARGELPERAWRSRAAWRRSFRWPVRSRCRGEAVTPGAKQCVSVPLIGVLDVHCPHPLARHGEHPVQSPECIHHRVADSDGSALGDTVGLDREDAPAVSGIHGPPHQPCQPLQWTLVPGGTGHACRPWLRLWDPASTWRC